MIVILYVTMNPRIYVRLVNSFEHSVVLNAVCGSLHVANGDQGRSDEARTSIFPRSSNELWRVHLNSTPHLSLVSEHETGLTAINTMERGLDELVTSDNQLINHNCTRDNKTQKKAQEINIEQMSLILDTCWFHCGSGVMLDTLSEVWELQR